MRLSCKRCGNEFYIRPSKVQVGKGIYCSKGCYFSSRNKKEERTCSKCGKKFMAFVKDINRGAANYCSQQCYWLSLKKISAKECAYCRERYKPYTKNQKFCSKGCYEKSKIVTLACTACGKIFQRKKYRVVEGAPPFCCGSCLSTWMMARRPRKDTKIEIKIENVLTENKILFEKQFRIKGISVVDFFIPPKTIIQCDGDYWHKLPTSIKRDAIQNRQLGLLGYSVLRFWEKDINSDINGCSKKIMEAIA